jgi:spermidine synthase
MSNYTETLYDSYGQQFRVDEMLFDTKTDHQRLVIFHNAMFGRVMALDGVIQTTERDEFVYHEMLTHVPILAHGDVKRVLIIGGGDGGILREVCKHSSIEHVTQVEIDQAVIDMCKKYLPNHSAGAYDDPRANIVIDDGINFVSNSQEEFDLIISDSTDPIGPGEVLFTSNFYESCKRLLKPGGLMVTQNGVAYMQIDEVKTTAKRMTPVFDAWHFYGASVPTYIGGLMTFAWGTDNAELRHVALNTIKQRFADSGIKTRYYNPEVHMCSFALPQYIVEAIGKDSNEYR